jgi:DNA-directed RNA polymerase specialized sigma24 family protein
MDEQGEVTCWLAALKGGDAEAAGPLWEHYCGLLLAVARRHLADAPRRAADVEDVALSAFASFCRGVEGGRFSPLEDRDDLRQVLLMLTARKAADWRRHEQCQKRGGGELRGESGLVGPGGEGGLGEVVGGEPSPAQVAEVAEQFRRMLEALPNEDLRKLVLGKFEGYTNQELADRFGFSLAKVERKLNLVREIWERLYEVA